MMFPHTLQKPLNKLLNIMQCRVMLHIVFLLCTIRISYEIHIPPEWQTTSPAPPGGGTVSSVLDNPPVTTANKQKNKELTTSFMEYINDEESVYYEYENVNQTLNDEKYCTFTLYVSSTANKNSDGGCKTEAPGDSKPQVGRGTIVSAGDITMKRSLNRAERKIDRLQGQLNRQSETITRLQNQIFAMSKSDEAGLCDSSLGWVRHGESCYWFGPHHVSWEAARVICQAKGKNSDLAVPANEVEIKVLASYAMYYEPLYSWWLGCSQYEIEEDWQCVDGNPLNYSNWRADHPTGYNNSRCLQLGHPSKIELIDTQCEQKWPFACEKPLKSKRSS